MDKTLIELAASVHTLLVVQLTMWLPLSTDEHHEEVR
jgi:hypothetical protein